MPTSKELVEKAMRQEHPITGFIRDGKFKVTTQIQDQQIRVTGKSRDELQAVMGALRAREFPVDLQFQNFRD
jgi:hypothetical protein